MNTPIAALAAGLLAIGAASSAFAPSSLASDATPAKSDPAAPKTHILFMGADCNILHDSRLCPVTGVSGSAFLIKDGDRFVKIPTDQGPFSMNVKYGLKLTEQIVKIDDLKVDRAYTPAADPVRKWGSANLVADMAADAASYAGRVAARTPETVRQVVGGGPGGTITAEVSNPDYGKAVSNYNNISKMANSDVSNAGYNAQKLQEELDKKLFDALDMSFAVSSPTPLDTPYVVVIVQFRAKDRPDHLRQLTFAKELDPIRDGVVKIRTRQAGFPPGFELEKYEVHIYNGGRELASNVTDKKVMLSDAETLQYLVIDHVTRNKGATVPGRWALGRIPLDTRSRLGDERYNQTFYVKVTKDGYPKGVYTDERCRHKADDDIGQLVAPLRFVPALDKGKAVDGVAPFTPAQPPI